MPDPGPGVQPTLPASTPKPTRILPAAKTHDQRVNDLYEQYLEMVALEDINSLTAVRAVLDMAVPADEDMQKPLPAASKVMLAGLILVVATFAGAGVLWTIGYLIIPMYMRAAGWMF